MLYHKVAILLPMTSGNDEVYQSWTYDCGADAYHSSIEYWSCINMLSDCSSGMQCLGIHPHGLVLSTAVEQMCSTAWSS